MKGTITNCLAQLVETKFGPDKWVAIVADAGVQNDSSLKIVLSDVPDHQVGRLLASTCKVLKITPAQAADAFGEFWCCDYAPKQYKAIYARFKSPRDMILGLDHVHVDMTATIDNAHPPRFEYTWEKSDTLLVHYKSRRDMIDIYIGLVHGVGKYFKQPIRTTKVSPSEVRLEFAAA
jgi:hypothetical protein